jgi:hypothetical protein
MAEEGAKYIENKILNKMNNKGARNTIFAKHLEIAWNNHKL